jgi:hypothetical protein
VHGWYEVAVTGCCCISCVTFAEAASCGCDCRLVGFQVSRKWLMALMAMASCCCDMWQRNGALIARRLRSSPCSQCEDTKRPFTWLLLSRLVLYTTAIVFLLLLLLLLGVRWDWVHSLAYVPASDDGWWWLEQWNDWQGKPKYSEETCPSAALSTTNPTWPDLGSNASRAVGSRRLTAWARRHSHRNSLRIDKEPLDAHSERLLRKTQH